MTYIQRNFVLSTWTAKQTDQPPKKLSKQGVQQSEDEVHKKETIELLANKILPTLQTIFSNQSAESAIIQTLQWAA